MSITAPMPAVKAATWVFCQTSRMPPIAGDDAREAVGGDAVRGDVEAHRGHAARIVADALQGEPER
jgi:hypothetical protein